MNNKDYGKPRLEGIQYCIRCCIPATQELVKFDEMGICQACQSSEQKIHIDWVEKGKELEKILNEAKANAGNNYDCIIPISGGKDSTFQLHVLTKIYGMKPLAVTFSHNWYSETGWYNLMNSLEKFNVDHIMFTPNRSLVNRIAKRSLEAIGDTCWHCHAGVGAFPLQVAVRFNIPLLIYGESIAESSGRSSYKNPLMEFNVDYFMKVSTKRNPKSMVCDYITEQDMKPFFFPSIEELEETGVRLMHLGDYIFWDDERQMEFVRDHYDWKETEVEGTYKGYKSAECIMPGMHDYTNYLKRGYGRATYQASVDVRNGLLTREEGFELSKKYDSEIPESLDYYLKITGMTKEEFYRMMMDKRLPELKDLELPVTIKTRKNKERIMPFPEQLVEAEKENLNKEKSAE
jgi:N-acetyl sugar amidotransferase